MSSNSSSAQNQLLYELSKGNELAFTKLYNQYKNLVFSTALKITKSKDLSQEIVQDVFLKIWQKKESLKEIADFESYLFIIARNHIFNMIKKIARETSYKNNFKYNDLSFDLTDTPLEDEQYDMLLDQILKQLPAQQLKVFKMVRIEGLSYEKIAMQLDISPLTVKKHMSLALKFIRLQLTKHTHILALSLSYIFSQN